MKSTGFWDFLTSPFFVRKFGVFLDPPPPPFVRTSYMEAPIQPKSLSANQLGPEFKFLM